MEIDPVGLSRTQSSIIEVIRGTHSVIDSSRRSHRWSSYMIILRVVIHIVSLPMYMGISEIKMNTDEQSPLVCRGSQKLGHTTGARRSHPLEEDGGISLTFNVKGVVPVAV